MPRASRLIAKGEQAVYHVMSRTALDGYPFGDGEKDMLVRIMKRFSLLYFTEVLGFCVMGNHFHLLVRMLPESDFSDAEIIERMQAFYGKEITVDSGQLPLFAGEAVQPLGICERDQTGVFPVFQQAA